MNEDRIAVVMCTWSRIHERLPATLNMLIDQDDMSYDLFIWNNNISLSNDLHAICDKYDDINITIYDSSRNIGGIGRFKMARKISGQYEYVLFIDDDINFSSSTISVVKDNREKNVIKSWWAWEIFGDNYWNRKRIVQTGRPASYCGTAMMVCETKVFNDNRIFKLIPEEYSFIEDLWLTYFCKNMLSMKCEYLPTDCSLVIDGKDQCLNSSLASPDKKRQFYRYLLNNIEGKNA